MLTKLSILLQQDRNNDVFIQKMADEANAFKMYVKRYMKQKQISKKVKKVEEEQERVQLTLQRKQEDAERRAKEAQRKAVELVQRAGKRNEWGESN